MRPSEPMRNHGKDELPHRTIAHIRRLLHELGVFTIEKVWVNSLDIVYSVRVELDGTGFGTNGKGIGPEYALASAYGEFMERLQNGILYCNVDFDGKVDQRYGFCHSPDEKYLPSEQFLDTLPKMAEKVFSFNPNDRGQALKCLRHLERDAPLPREGHLLSLPFFNSRTYTLDYVPVSIRDYVYGSNGMAAGNTFREAMVQGLSEIFERYVQLHILTNDISPPTIPDSYIERFPFLADLKRRIEAKSGNKVIVKDASLGRGLPVLAVIFLNTSDNSYFVRFGAHPEFEIALERCFTEQFQGRTIDNRYGFTPFRYFLEDDTRKVSEFENTMQIARSGVGIYPNAFFSSTPTYEFEPYQKENFTSNTEMLTYFLSLLDSLGFDLLCRDVSYLGFPACHLIVPGLSEIYYINSTHFRNIGMKRKARETLRRGIFSSDTGKMKEVIDYFEAFYGKDRKIGDQDLIGFASTDDFPLKKVSVNLFLCIACISVGDLTSAYSYVSRELERVSSPTSEAAKYYRCIRDIVAMKIDSRGAREIKGCLSSVYGEERTAEALDDIDTGERLFQNVPRMPCFNCTSCSCANDCHYRQVEALHLRLKEAKMRLQIDQMHCSELLTHDTAGSVFQVQGAHHDS